MDFWIQAFALVPNWTIFQQKSLLQVKVILKFLHFISYIVMIWWYDIIILLFPLLNNWKTKCLPNTNKSRDLLQFLIYHFFNSAAGELISITLFLCIIMRGHVIYCREYKTKIFTELFSQLENPKKIWVEQEMREVPSSESTRKSF